ncbi:aldo/keto reductase [Mesorhizobium sp. ORM8.1]
MEMMERLRSSGRIKAVGVSNFSTADMDSARQHGVIDVLQPPYNMLWREVEAETLPYCRKHNIGVARDAKSDRESSKNIKLHLIHLPSIVT